MKTESNKVLDDLRKRGIKVHNQKVTNMPHSQEGYKDLIDGINGVIVELLRAVSGKAHKKAYVELLAYRHYINNVYNMRRRPNLKYSSIKITQEYLKACAAFERLETALKGTEVEQYTMDNGVVVTTLTHDTDKSLRMTTDKDGF